MMHDENVIVATRRPAFQYRPGLPDRRGRLRPVRTNPFVKSPPADEDDLPGPRAAITPIPNEWMARGPLGSRSEADIMQPVHKIDEPSTELPRRRYRIGFLKGQITVPDDFDTMGQDEILAMFEG